mmetsp:Transcript_45168/g.175254  ORF Transcript_45168/g.175254 Transcript_45168/m.175254 type:complete len:104 (+) Transcript_45168:2702-3013(+)
MTMLYIENAELGHDYHSRKPRDSSMRNASSTASLNASFTAYVFVVGLAPLFRHHNNIGQGTPILKKRTQSPMRLPMAKRGDMPVASPKANCKSTDTLTKRIPI